MKQVLKIIQDTREQRPFGFSGYPVQVEVGTLNSGDYSLYGFEDSIAVERKSLPDLISCFTSNRERFTRELERLRGYESAVVVAEAGYTELITGNYRSKLTPQSAEQTVISIMQRYRMPFFFANNASIAEKFTYDFIRHFYRHAEKRYKALY